MARYNRDFLIPYLRDVYSLHLLERKIAGFCSSLSYSISVAKKKRMPEKPMKGYIKMGDDWEPFSMISGGLSLLLAVLFWFMADDKPSMIKLFAWFFTICGVPTLFIPLLMWYSRSNHNEEVERKYKRELDAYNAQCSKAKADGEAEIRSLMPQLRAWEQEKAKVENLLLRAYSANVIPTKYRNIYAAAYVYDWFSSGGSDDMDMALNTFVLEEIKDRLDVIIENQAQMMLNQRMIMANQQRSLEQQQEHASSMRTYAQQIAGSNYERNQYLSMIEANTATTAFFATADYIRRL